MIILVMYYQTQKGTFMKKKKSWMRYSVIALVAILFSVLIAACKSPESPIPQEELQEDTHEPDIVYDVTYFGNTNTAGEAPVDTNKYSYGKDQVALQDRGNLYKVGYRFTGWNTKQDGTGKQYTENEETTMGDSRMELYAQWENVFPLISAGDGFSALITKEGKLYTTGRGANGRLGNGSTSSTDQHEFTEVKINGLVKSVSSGTDHSIAILQNGSIAGWGYGDWGKLGLNQDSTTAYAPSPPIFSGTSGSSNLGEVEYVSAGRYQTAVLTKNGEYWAAGSKSAGALGNGEPVGAVNREKVLQLIDRDVVSVAAGLNYVVLIKTNGSMWIAGEGANGKLGTGLTSNMPKLRENTAIDHSNLKVFAGKNNHTMILKKDYRVMAAGLNSSGQLGLGNTTSQYFFSPVLTDDGAELTDAEFVSLGDNHSLILKKDGTLWAMGKNSESQLGVNPPSGHTKAFMVLDRVAHVAAGNNHTLVIKEDGTLMAAGSNKYGQFGRPPAAANETSIWTTIDISKIVPPLEANQPQDPAL
jgi:alpha-tubulin suppressor-like RCC1 family protein